MNDSLLHLVLARSRILRPAEKLLLLDVSKDLGSFLSLSRADVEGIVGRRLDSDKWKPASFLTEAERDLRWLEATGAGIVHYWDPRYPAQLREIYDPPFLLFFRGTLPAWETPLVAVVGTRQPTGAGVTAAYSFAFELGGSGIGVVSGLARGIDAAAHRGSIDGGGAGLAVLGCGLARIYPLSSRETAADLLASGGTIVSEYPPGTPPLKYHFPERNRIISGLSRSVVVIEAPRKSGALHTADFALEQGRELFIHRACTESPQGEGNRELAASGAHELSGAADLFEEWGVAYPPAAAGNAARAWAGQGGAGRRPCPETAVDTAGNLLAGLMEEELNGIVVPYNGIYFRRI